MITGMGCWNSYQEMRRIHQTLPEQLDYAVITILACPITISAVRGTRVDTEYRGYRILPSPPRPLYRNNAHWQIILEAILCLHVY